MSVEHTTLEVRNRLGLHLRAASVLAQTARNFTSSVTVSRGKRDANARSVTGLIMLGAGQGAKLTIKADGADAKEALRAVETLFNDRFGEE